LPLFQLQIFIREQSPDWNHLWYIQSLRQPEDSYNQKFIQATFGMCKFVHSCWSHHDRHRNSETQNTCWCVHTTHIHKYSWP
jgi:hypothetical protein